MGWQALFITNAEGLFSLAAPLPLPSGSLAAQTTQHKRICAASGKLCLPLKLLQAASTLGVANSCLPQRAQLASEGDGFTDKAARCRFVLPTLSPLPNGAAQTVDITKMTGKKIVRIYSNLKRAFLTGCPLGLQESQTNLLFCLM
ncbi:MAG: hypothetical protein RBQ66_02020 [Candidatus Cloacimonadaceae bacterium]|jgi:hypothetical protein|nr:hypothetical protein [Candidatus Cloacimonadaceae bacterium]